MANRLFIGFLLLMLLALLGWGGVWFLQNFERQTEESRSGYSAAARRNPLLAAERFLQRLGKQVESLSGRGHLKAPPERAGVMLVKDLGPSLPLAQEELLLEWVARGNHLIASLSYLPDEDEAQNHLLQRLEVRLVAQELGEQPNEPVPLEFQVPGDAEVMQVDFADTRALLTDREDMLLGITANQGFHLLTLAWGQGRITLLSDNGFLHNTEIERNDHALFLAALMDGYERGWLLYSSQMPSLLTLAWRFAPHLFVSSLLLLGMLIWWLTLRSGPILLQANPLRRNLLEHLQAAGEFNWRRDRAAGLLERCRKQLESRWLLKHPLLNGMNRQQRCRWLAERTGLAITAIEAALYAEQPHTGGLIKTSVIQQRLLAALHPDSRMEKS